MPDDFERDFLLGLLNRINRHERKTELICFEKLFATLSVVCTGTLCFVVIIVLHVSIKLVIKE